MWHYRVDEHMLLISRCGTSNYELRANHRLLGTYSDPIQAADELAYKQTGCEVLDEALATTSPRDLADWKPGPPVFQSI